MIQVQTRTWFSAVVGAVVVVGAIVLGQTAMRGQTDRWYPSRWGVNDQRGGPNGHSKMAVLKHRRASSSSFAS
jgi:hypothetical protein